MPIKYKIDILNALKEKGFTSYRIRKEKLFGQKTLQDFRNGNVVLSAECLEKLCNILDCLSKAPNVLELSKITII